MQAITTGTTTQHDGYSITEMGTVKLGRSTYKVQAHNSISVISGEMKSELQLTGPRGALYTLQETRRPGVYAPINLMSGPMKRHGNQVFVTVLGDLIEETN